MSVREKRKHTHTFNSLKKEEKANPFTEATKNELELLPPSGLVMAYRRGERSGEGENPSAMPTHTSADEKGKERLLE